MKISFWAVLLLQCLAFHSPNLAAGTPWGANYFPNVPLTTQDGPTWDDPALAEMTDLWHARNRFEAEFRRVKASIEREVGIARRWNWGWAATLTAVAAGLALGYSFNRKLRSRKREAKRLD